jgi:hypothetical protein
MVGTLNRRETIALLSSAPENGGKRHEIYVPYVVGFSSHSLTREQVESRALDLITPRMGAARAKRVVDRVRELELVSEGRELISMIAS